MGVSVSNTGKEILNPHLLYRQYVHFSQKIVKVSCYLTASLNTQGRPGSQPVVLPTNFNKGGSRHSHAHNLGVAQLPRPYF